MVTRGDAAIRSTRSDLADPKLVSWVRDQLILEGPTAREALFVRAIDDLSQHADKFWLYSHIDPDSLDEETQRFTTRMLLPYDPTRDYGPWMQQVSDSAISSYVQRTNERVVTADVFGAEYVAASMFEARLLRRRRGGDDHGVPHAAMWADVPLLPNLMGPRSCEAAPERAGRRGPPAQCASIAGHGANPGGQGRPPDGPRARSRGVATPTGQGR
jgi:hypothetical protein